MGNSIADRAANGDHEDADELFPTGSVDGDAKTLASLIPKGMAVKSTVSLLSGEVPGGGGLFDPGAEGRLLVSFELGKVETVPIREEGKVASWKIRQHVRPVYIERVKTSGDDIEAGFALLLDGDPKAAGALLDRLQKRASKALTPA